MDFDGVRRRGGKDGIKIFSNDDVPDPYENKEKPLFTTHSSSRCFGLLSFKGIILIVVVLLVISGVGLYLSKETAQQKYSQIFTKDAQNTPTTATTTAESAKTLEEPLTKDNIKEVDFHDKPMSKEEAKKPVKKAKRREEEDEEDEEEDGKENKTKKNLKIKAEKKAKEHELQLKKLQEEILRRKELTEKKQKQLEELERKLKQQEAEMKKKPAVEKTEEPKVVDTQKEVDDLIENKKIEAEEEAAKQERKKTETSQKEKRKMIKKLVTYERYLTREPKINVKDRRINDLKREEYRLRRVKEMKEFQIQKLKELQTKPVPPKIHAAYKKTIDSHSVQLVAKEPPRFHMEKLENKNEMFKHVIDDYFDGKIQKGCPLVYFSSTGKYEFEIGNVDGTDKIATNSKDILEFFTSYSPVLTNKKKIHLEVIDIDKWNMEDTSAYEQLIRVPGDMESIKPPLLFYNEDFIYYKNPSIYPMKQLKVNNPQYYTKWKLPSSYCFKTAEESRLIRIFFDQMFHSERMFVNVNIEKISKPIRNLWCDGEAKAKEYFKSMNDLIRKELVGLTIFTKGNLPMFNYSPERRRQLMEKSIQFIDRLYSSKLLTLTVGKPRIPFYSAIYGKPIVPRFIYRFILKSLHKVFKSTALGDERPEMKEVKMTRKISNNKKKYKVKNTPPPVPPPPDSKLPNYNLDDHHAPTSHDEKHADDYHHDIPASNLKHADDSHHHIPPPPPPPSLKQPKYIPKVKPKEKSKPKPKRRRRDDDDDDDEDDEDDYE